MILGGKDVYLIKERCCGKDRAVVSIDDLEFIVLEHNKEDDTFICYVYEDANDNKEPVASIVINPYKY